MARKPKYEQQTDQLEELHRLRKRGAGPANTDPRFALAFEYEWRRGRAVREADERREREHGPWRDALRGAWFARGLS